MSKKYIKKKAGPNQAGPKYRTPDHFKGKRFKDSGSKEEIKSLRFNPERSKIKHRG
jgi:hypothetical protein